MSESEGGNIVDSSHMRAPVPVGIVEESQI
jgi:hypothetical protein